MRCTETPRGIIICLCPPIWAPLSSCNCPSDTRERRLITPTDPRFPDARRLLEQQWVVLDRLFSDEEARDRALARPHQPTRAVGWRPLLGGLPETNRRRH